MYSPLPRSRERTKLSPRFQKLRERFQRDFRDMMLDAFGVGLRRFGRHAERAENIDHQPVADAHAVGERLALLGQEHAAIRPRRCQPGALEARIVLIAVAWDTPRRRAMSVGRASPACQKVGDQLDIIFQQRGRLRRTCLAEAARLRAFRGKLPPPPARAYVSPCPPRPGSSGFQQYSGFRRPRRTTLFSSCQNIA